MESIINLILDNIFFVLIILFALLNMFGRSKQEEDEKRKQPQRRSSTSQRTEIPNERREIPKPVQTTVEEMLSEAEVNPTAIEDQRQEQFERLRQQYQTSHSQADLDRAENLAGDLTNSAIQVESQAEEKHDQINPNLSEKLTQKGLIESVIMAEVLGPPKARQRFSNRYNRR